MKGNGVGEIFRKALNEQGCFTVEDEIRALGAAMVILERECYVDASWDAYRLREMMANQAGRVLLGL
jgi:hypothetical protein